MEGLRRVIVVGLVTICFVVLGRLIYLDYFYFAHAPRFVDPGLGATVPVTVHHGARVYLTVSQWTWFQSPEAMIVQCTLFLGAMVAAYALNRRWKVFRDLGRVGQ